MSASEHSESAEDPFALELADQYGSHFYWDTRYKKKSFDDFEWYFGWREMRKRKLLDAYLTNGKETKILMLGCGNSLLSFEMFSDGYTNIVNVDISDVVIKKMQEKYSECKGMTWFTMDARELTFPDESFDLVLDKGTIDAISCGVTAPTDIAQVNKQVSRVLTRGGFFVVISYGPPELRAYHFENTAAFKWEYSQSMFTIDSSGDDSSSYYLYACKRMLKDPPPLPPKEEGLTDATDDDVPTKFRVNPVFADLKWK